MYSASTESVRLPSFEFSGEIVGDTPVSDNIRINLQEASWSRARNCPDR